jgi:DNA replication licensing factor MCM2
VDGRYNSTRTFAENVELTEPILSRFDILFVVKDTADPASDGRLAEFVTASHMRAHPDAPGVLAAEPGAVPVPTTIPDLPRQTPDGVDPLTQDQLKKYIAYAKSTCKPKLAAADADKIASVYAHLRAESAVASGMPVAVRHLESIIRMSEAHACMHLRDYVADADVDAALRMMLGSFVATQKLQVQKAMRAKFAKYLTTAAGDRELLLAALQGLAREHARFAAVVGGDDSDGRVRVPLRALEEKAREYGVADLGPLLRSAALADAGFSLEGSHLVQEA